MALSDKVKDAAAKAKEGAVADKGRLKKAAEKAETFAAEHGAEARTRSAEARAHAKDKLKQS